MNKITRTILMLVVTALVSVACGSATPAISRPPLTVGWILWGGWYPIVIAQKQGLFEKHGVAVNPVFYDIYSQIPSDFASGKLDGALVSLYDILPVESQNQNSHDKVVMITDDTVGADAILAGPEIKTVADLKGKRLGVKLGSYIEVMVARMLEQNHLSTSDVQLVNVEPENALLALQAHQVEAVHSYEPIVSQMETQGYHTLFSSAETPGLMPNVLAFSGSVLRDRPEDVKAFVAAWLEAQAFWQANPEAGNQLIAEATGQKPEDISLKGIALRSLSDNQKAFAVGTDTTSVYYSAKLNLDFLIQSGNITKAPDTNILLDPAFLK